MRYVYAEGLVDGIVNCVEIWVQTTVLQAEREGFLEFMEVYGTGASFVQVLDATSFGGLTNGKQCNLDLAYFAGAYRYVNAGGSAVI